MSESSDSSEYIESSDDDDVDDEKWTNCIRDSKQFTTTIKFSDDRTILTPHQLLGKAGNKIWAIIPQEYVGDNVEYMMLSLVAAETVNEVICSFRCAICVVNEDPEKNFVRIESRCVQEKIRYYEFMQLDEIFAEGSGYLKNGELKMRIEIRVGAIIDLKGNRLFNIYDPFENCVIFERIPDHSRYYGNKQIVTYHCKVSQLETIDEETKFPLELDAPKQAVEDFLQIIHGSYRFHPFASSIEDDAEERLPFLELAQACKAWPIFEFYKQQYTEYMLFQFAGGPVFSGLSWNDEKLDVFKEICHSIIPGAFSLESYKKVVKICFSFAGNSRAPK